MTGDAVRAVSAEYVARIDDRGLSADLERDTQRPRIVFDRSNLGAVFDLDPGPSQVIAQDLLGAPLRLAALKFIAAVKTAKVRARDLTHARAEDLNVPDVHAGADERLNQAGPVEDVEHARLERGPARLVMRLKSLLDDAGLDAMAHQFAGREQSRRTASDNQDRRLVDGLTHFESNRASSPQP